MKNSYLRSRWLRVALFPLLLAINQASAQTLKVLTSGAFKPALVELAPQLEAATGNRLEIQNDTAGGLLKRIRGGEHFDIVIQTMQGLNTLAVEKKVQANSLKPIVKVGVGIAVSTGSSVRSVNTVDQFKQLMLNARKVAYTDPASGGSSGIYLDGLFQRLGIADAIRAKAILGQGGLNAEYIVKGEADVAVQQLSELLAVPGVTVIGPLPEEIQNYTIYGVGIAAESNNKAAAASLIKALTSAQALQVMHAKGMQPAQ